MKNSRFFKLIVLVGILFVSTAAVFQSCEKPRPPRPLSEDPIATIGHGSFLNHEGKPIKATEPFIRQVQDLYIRKLSDAKLAVRQGGTFDPKKSKTTKDLIYSTVKNDVMANALYIEWLIQQRRPVDEAQYSAVNNALRWQYVLNIQKDPILPDQQKRWSKGIPDDQAKKLEDKGIQVYAITNSSMPAYVEECLAAGVPVPQNMFGPEWKNLGEIENEFISQTNEATGVELRAELMIYVSSNPEGFCLALPRYRVRGSVNEPELFGVICLGASTSKACFFDNPAGNIFPRDQIREFRTNFVGGRDLVANDQGICTDCHAGENPYIVHPAKRPFMKMLDDNLDGNPADALVRSTMPARWYDPIVVGEWPQNPGPLNILDAIPSTGQCDSCHRAGGSGGRFPDLSFPLPGYCANVLRNAVRTVAAGGTMPAGIESVPVDQQAMVRAQFQPHINALTFYCSLTRQDGELQTASIPANPTFISPPLIIGPVYACATQVAVRGAVLDASVTLRINGGGGPDGRGFTISPARSPLQINFTGLPALNARDVLTATQQIAGEVSAESTPVTVRNYRDDYPSGVPTPVIDPNTVYLCAELIAVRNLPGATVTVLTNGADPRSFITSTGWSVIAPSGAPFSEPATFTVTASMCGDTSDPSNPVSARPGPTTLPKPAFNPRNIYDGQELLTVEDIVYGARVTLRETRSSWTGAFSTPVNWFPNYDIRTAMGRALRTGDSLEAMQGLCTTTSDWTPAEMPHDCERLPAPQIERPIRGAMFVIVSRSVPGARIMVYDSRRNEIGDGSGTVIVLNRAIIGGERLTVVQRVGQCTSRFVYVVRATGGE